MVFCRKTHLTLARDQRHYQPHSVARAPILIHTGQAFDYIDKAHKETGHQKQRGTSKYLKDTMLVENVSPDIINAYLSCCSTCEATQLRKNSTTRRAAVPRVIISTHFGQRGQVGCNLWPTSINCVAQAGVCRWTW